MRINRYIAASTGMSRRAADAVVSDQRVLVNGKAAEPGTSVGPTDTVTLDGRPIAPAAATTILLHKPRGFVTSRNGQGSKTIYDLLPPELHHLKPVGRLDKDSSGLLLVTNDGERAQQLTHPSSRKTKIYEITLDAPLAPLHRQMISDIGVSLEDGRSQLMLERLRDADDTAWRVAMHEGRNRQIRRTFAALGYTVTTLHRTHFGSYRLGILPRGKYKAL